MPHEAETCSQEEGVDKQTIKGMQEDAEIQYKNSEDLIYFSPRSPLPQPLLLQFVILPWGNPTQIKHTPSIENFNS
jgi:hypothetical protein